MYSLAARLQDYKRRHNPYEMFSLLSVFYAEDTVESEIKCHMATKRTHTLLNGDGRLYNEYYVLSDEALANYQEFIEAKNITTFTHRNIMFIVRKKF